MEGVELNAGPAPRTAIQTVLLVGGESAARETLRRTLASDRYRIVEAPDAPAAFERASTLGVPVAVLLVPLPGGTDLVRRLKGRPLSRPVFVAIVGPWTSFANVRDALAAGADCYASASSAPAEVRRIVEQALGIAVQIGSGARRVWWFPDGRDPAAEARPFAPPRLVPGVPRSSDGADRAR